MGITLSDHRHSQLLAAKKRPSSSTRGSLGWVRLNRAEHRTSAAPELGMRVDVPALSPPTGLLLNAAEAGNRHAGSMAVVLTEVAA